MNGPAEGIALKIITENDGAQVGVETSKYGVFIAPVGGNAGGAMLKKINKSIHKACFLPTVGAKRCFCMAKQQ